MTNIGANQMIMIQQTELSFNNCSFVENWVGSILSVGDSSSHSTAITESVTLTNVLIQDNFVLGYLMSVGSAAVTFNNVSLSNNIVKGFMVFSWYSIWDINQMEVVDNVLPNGGFYLVGYQSPPVHNHTNALHVSLSDCLFSGNSIALYPLFSTVDTTVVATDCAWVENTDIYDTDNVLYQLLSFTTTMPSYEFTLEVTNSYFENNVNLDLSRASIIAIDITSGSFVFTNTTLLNNSGNFPAIDILSEERSSGEFNQLIMQNNTGGISTHGSVFISDTIISGGVSSVLKILGLCSLNNVIIRDNENTNLNEALIEVGIEIGINPGDNVKTLILVNSQISSNYGASGIIQASDAIVVVQNSTFADNEATLISGSMTLVSCSLNITDSTFMENESPLGGVFSIVGTVANIHNTNFIGNRAFFGGVGFVDEDSFIYMNSSLFEANTASERGGALLLQGSGTIRNVSFVNNTGVTEGGAIAFAGQCNIQFYDCSFSLNLGGSGGALTFSTLAHPILDSCQFITNMATSSGGALLLAGEASPTFLNCLFWNNTAFSIGGAASLTETSTPAFSNCNISNNYSPNEAGGVHCTDESFIIMADCVLEENRAGASGGAFAFGVAADGVIEHTVISRNTAFSKGGGIAFYNHCHPTLTKIQLIENEAGSGAGLWITDGASPSVNDSLFYRNIAPSIGGGILSSDHAKGNITNSWFMENKALSGAGGGAMLQDFGTTEFHNCTFTANHAQNGGGLFSVAAEGPHMTNSTFTLNIASINGGGIALAENCSAMLTEISCTLNIAYGSGGCIFLSDITAPVINELSAHNNLAASFGGALLVGDQSRPIITNSIFSANTATSGGGCMVEQTGGGRIEGTQIRDNIVGAFGGGILYQGSNLFMKDILVQNNTATDGGGICVDGTTEQLANVTICQHCTISANRADRGGGIYVELSTNNGYDDEVPIFDSNESFTFEETSITNNFANYGAGIYYNPSTAPTVNFYNPLLYNNVANRFGGGVYIAQVTNVDTNNDAWVFNGDFRQNHAFYGGYNAAWKAISSSSDPGNFCLNCSLPPSTQIFGYSNSLGFASNPSILSFVSACPSTTTLNEVPFDISLELLDDFGTLVNGTILALNNYTLSLSNSGLDCEVHPSDPQVRIPLPGVGGFTNLTVQGKNDSVCALRFFVTSQPMISTISSSTCKIHLSGCPQDYNVVEQDEFDTCEYCKYLYRCFTFLY